MFTAHSLMFAVVAAMVSSTIAAPAGEAPIPIISQTQEGPNPDGSYKWAFEAGNGIKANEEGHIEGQGPDNEIMKAQGAFSYKGDDGEYSITYTADERGFLPVGAHLPTPPPIPEAIQRALEWNASHPGEGDDSSRRRRSSAAKPGSKY